MHCLPSTQRGMSGNDGSSLTPGLPTISRLKIHFERLSTDSPVQHHPGRYRQGRDPPSPYGHTPLDRLPSSGRAALEPSVLRRRHTVRACSHGRD